MERIEWEDFEKVELRVGTVVRCEPLPEARKPSYRMWIDFGEFGTRTSSAQITALYRPEDVVGRQVVAVLNFEPRRIAGFASEVLTCGLPDAEGNVALVGPDRPVPNGGKLF